VYKKKRFFVMIGLLLFISACSKQAPQNSSKQPTNEQTVIIQEVMPRNLNEYIRITGVIEGETDILLNSEVSGKIIEIYKSLGDKITKGETIAKIDNKDFEIQVLQAEANLLAAEASKEALEKQFQSNLQLYNDNIISELEYQNSVSAYKNATAQWQGALANLEIKKRILNNSMFIAPVSGSIVDLPIKIGQTVSVNQKIAGIVDLDKLMIRTGVGEKSILLLKNNQKATVLYNNKQYPAKISGIGYKLLSSIANYPIEIKLDNKNNDLIPGMIVSVEVLVNTHQDIFYTSLNHILQDYDQNYVYVVDNDNKIIRKNVTLGKQISENVIIKEGLIQGDMLVIEGYENVEPDMKVITRIFETKNNALGD